MVTRTWYLFLVNLRWCPSLVNKNLMSVTGEYEPDVCCWWIWSSLVYDEWTVLCWLCCWWLFSRLQTLKDGLLYRRRKILPIEGRNWKRPMLIFCRLNWLQTPPPSSSPHSHNSRSTFLSFFFLSTSFICVSLCKRSEVAFFQRMSNERGFLKL